MSSTLVVEGLLLWPQESKPTGIGVIGGVVGDEESARAVALALRTDNVCSTVVGVEDVSG